MTSCYVKFQIRLPRQNVKVVIKIVIFPSLIYGIISIKQFSMISYQILDTQNEIAALNPLFY